MFRIFWIGLFIGNAGVISAQDSYLWSKQYGYNLSDEFFNGVIPLSDGTVLAFGSQNNNQGYLQDPWICKISAQGDSLYAGPLFTAPGSEIVKSGATDDASNIYLTGSSNSEDTIELFGQAPLTQDIWVVKLDSALNIVWASMYPRINNESVDDILIDGASLWLAGSSNINDTSLITASGKDYYLMKISTEDGSLEESRTYGGTSYDEAYMLLEDGDHIIMGGYTQSPDGDIAELIGFRDGWILRIDKETLDIVAQVTVGFANGDVPSDMIRSADNGIVLLGQSASPALPGFHGLDDIWVCKLDENLQVQWQYAYGGGSLDSPGGMVQAPDGRIIINGYTNSIDGDIPFNWLGMNQIIMALNPADGALLAVESYGGDLEDGGYGICILNGDLYSAGYTDSVDGDLGKHGNHNGWVMRLDMGTGLGETVQNTQRAHIYPNPATSFCIVEGLDSTKPVIITDIMGRRYNDGAILPAHRWSSVLELEGLAPGIYMITQVGSDVALRLIVR